MQQNMRKQPSLINQLIDVFLIEFTNWRWSWQSMLILGTAAPLLSLVGLGVFAHDSGRTALEYVLIGSIVLSLMFGIMSNITNHFLFMRFQGTLDYFATLPVRRPILIGALVLAFFCISLPSILVTTIVGSLLLGVQLAPSLLVIIVIPLCALSISGIGALIGIQARTPQEASAVQLLLQMLLIGIGPVVVPPNKLPAISLLIGHISPTTYAAEALRQVLLGPVNAELFVDIAVLVGVTIVTFWLVGYKLHWRRTT